MACNGLCCLFFLNFFSPTMLFTFTLQCLTAEVCVCVLFCQDCNYNIMLFLHWWPAFNCSISFLATILFFVLHPKKVNTVQKCCNNGAKTNKKMPQAKIVAITETRQELKPTNPQNRRKRKMVHRGKEAKPQTKRGGEKLRHRSRPV